MFIQATDHLVPHEVANIFKTSKNVFNDYIATRTLDPKVIKAENFGTLTNELFIPTYKSEQRSIADSAAKYLTKGDPNGLKTERKQINELFTKLIDVGYTEALEFIGTVSEKKHSFLNSIKALIIAETANFVSGDFDPKVCLLEPLHFEALSRTFIKDLQHSFGILISDESSELLAKQFFNTFLKNKHILGTNSIFEELCNSFMTLSDNDKINNDQKSEVLNEAIKYSKGINTYGLSEILRKKTKVRPVKDPIITEPRQPIPLRDALTPKSVTITLHDKILSLLKVQYPTVKEGDLRSMTKELVHAKDRTKFSDDQFLYGLSMYAWPEITPEKAALGRIIPEFLTENSRQVTRRKQLVSYA